MEKAIKIYIKTDEVVDNLLVQTDLNLKLILEDEIALINDEISLEGEVDSRCVIPYFLSLLAAKAIEMVIKRAAEKSLEKIEDDLVDYVFEKHLYPKLKSLIGFLRSEESRQEFNYSCRSILLDEKTGNLKDIDLNNLSPSQLKEMSDRISLMIEIKTNNK